MEAFFMDYANILRMKDSQSLSWTINSKKRHLGKEGKDEHDIVDDRYTKKVIQLQINIKYLSRNAGLSAKHTCTNGNYLENLIHKLGWKKRVSL